jgi:hypothetical protein
MTGQMLLRFIYILNLESGVPFGCIDLIFNTNMKLYICNLVPESTVGNECSGLTISVKPIILE